MVFAIGSVAASDADDKSHFAYFERAKQHLGGLDCLGSAHLETVQTLAIMGGLYLHYLQSPNMANSIMGACFRMATALGLHREYVEARPKAVTTNPAFSVDMRRRVWWSIFVLDSWANMTLGRPSMGRWGPSITANPPLWFDDRGQRVTTLLLVENIKFCKIATQIEDTLAITPLVPIPEMMALDGALVDWYKQLPYTLQAESTQGVSESIISTRTIMRWRYQLTRLVLHRPVLLNYAMRRIPSSQLRQEEQEAIDKCRTVAKELIADIANSCRPNQICGWNGLWFTYQAVMVPLLSLFSDPHDLENVESSRSSVELALQAMTQMMHHSPTGKKSVDATSRIYEASKRLIADTRCIIEKSAAATAAASSLKRPRKKPNHQPTPQTETTPSTSTKTQSTLNNHPTSSLNSTTLLSPLPQDTNALTQPTEFFNEFHQRSAHSTSSFQAYNPTNLPSDSSTSDLAIQTMWDSLNWSINGCENFDFMNLDVDPGFGWPDNLGLFSTHAAPAAAASTDTEALVGHWSHMGAHGREGGAEAEGAE